MLHILVADDEKDARDKMIRCIDRLQNGLTIVGAASDGYEALDQILSLRPDIVLIDIEMPGLSGLDVIRRVEDARLPVIFIIISSYSDFAYAQDALRLNVQEYLLKPFLPSEVCSAIYRAADQIYAIENMPGFSPVFSTSPRQKAPRIKRLGNALVYPFELEQALLDTLRLGKGEDVILPAFQAFSDAVMEHNPTELTKTDCFTILYVELHRMVIGLGGGFGNQSRPAEGGPLRSAANLSSALAQLCCRIGAFFAATTTVSTLVASATEYIDSHYAEDLSLEEVAVHAGISACYLSNQFNQKMNMRFTDYIHQVRISRAKELLMANPQMKGYEVSELVGYHSPKYFSQQFKKVTGMTLTQFCGANEPM